MVHNLGKSNSIFNQYIAEIRDIHIQGDMLRFRRNLERMGELFAYEISKTLQGYSQVTKTPLGTPKTSVPSEKLVLATVLRAGLPLHNG